MMMSRRRKKFFAFSGLVRSRRGRVDEWHTKTMVLDALADAEVAPVDVLGLRVVLGVVREVARRLVVEARE